jgi:tetratricopeptide (TPR) repeat protein
MKRINIFLSSAMNGELDDERKSIYGLFDRDEAIKNFYELYIIEKKATPKKVEDAYLDEIGNSDIIIFILKMDLRSGVEKEYQKARQLGRKVFIYLYNDESLRTDKLQQFITDEVYRYNPGFWDSTYDLLEKIRTDIQSDIVETYKLSISNFEDSVLRVELDRANSYYRYYSIETIEENKIKYEKLSSDQFIVLSEQIRNQTGNYKESLLVAEIGLSFFPDSWKIYNNRGITLDEMGLSEHAYQSYQKAYEINSEDETVLYNLGNYYANKNKYEIAIEYFLRSLAKNKQKMNAINKISVAYRNLKKYDRFLEYAQKAYDLENNEMYTINYVIALSENDKHNEAFTLLSEKINKDNPKFMITNAYLKWRMGKYIDVIEILGHGINVDNNEIALILFESYLYEQNLVGALESFDCMNNRLSFTSFNYNNCGFILKKHGYTKQSNEFLYKCIDIDPTFVEARITLTANLAEEKKYDEALSVCEEAIQMFPYEPKLIRNKYLIYFNQGKIMEGTLFIMERMFSITGLSDVIPSEILGIIKSQVEKQK